MPEVAIYSLDMPVPHCHRSQRHCSSSHESPQTRIVSFLYSDHWQQCFEHCCYSVHGMFDGSCQLQDVEKPALVFQPIETTPNPQHVILHQKIKVDVTWNISYILIKPVGQAASARPLQLPSPDLIPCTSYIWKESCWSCLVAYLKMLHNN